MRRLAPPLQMILFGALLGGVRAQAAPVLAPVRAVDAPVTTPAQLGQRNAGIAFGGGQYLAAWEDGTPQSAAIRATRISTAGALLDDPPLVIASTNSALGNPAVAWDGSKFLVVWQGPSGVSAQAGDIFGAYVDAMGTVGATFTVVGAMLSQTQPVVAGGDGHALVAWTTDVPPALTQVRATLLGTNAAVVRADFALNPLFSVSSEDSPVVAWGGATANAFLAAWMRPTGAPVRVFGATVDLAGTPSAQFRISSATSDAVEPALASDGSTFVAVWSDNRNFPKQDLIGRAVPFAAAPSAADFPVALAPVGGGYLRPQIAPAAGKLMVVWESPSPSGKSLLFGGRVLADGTRSDGDGVQISSAPPIAPRLLPSGVDARRSALASDGTKTLAAWTAPGTGVTGDDVYILPSDAAVVALSTGPSSSLGRARNYQISRSLASDGNVFLVVWEDDRNVVTTGLDLYGLRVDRQGVAIDAAPFVICDAPGDQFSPALAAWPGADFLVAWADGRTLDSGGNVDLYATRIGAMGAPRDAQGFVVSQAVNAQLYPTVAAKPDGWLVAWEDWRRTPSGKKDPGVWSNVVTSTGGLLGERAIVDAPDENGTACNAAAAWNGSRFLVAYEQPCSTNPTVATLRWDVLGRWVDNAGAIELSTVVLANQSGDESVPQLARIGESSDLVATWREQGAGERILAARITNGANAASGAVAIADQSGSTHAAPAVASLPGPSGRMLFTWIDNAAVMARVLPSSLVPDEPEFTVLADKTLRAPVPLPSTDALGNAASWVPRVTPPAAVALAPFGEALIAFDRLETLADKSTSRVHHRKLGVLPLGDACNGTAACASGICARGVCCDTPCEGVCQACSAKGCVETPDSDSRCGAAPRSCATESTTCRMFLDTPAAACFAFAQCADASHPAACDQFFDAPDGTGCASAGCSTVASCRGGRCICPDEPRALVPRPLPGGCSFGAGGVGATGAHATGADAAGEHATGGGATGGGATGDSATGAGATGGGATGGGATGDGAAGGGATGGGATGDSATGAGATGTLALALLVLLVALRRRGGRFWLAQVLLLVRGVRFWLAQVLRLVARGLLLLAMFGGCSVQPAKLELHLVLSDPVFAATDTARIVLASAESAAFPAAEPITTESGITVRSEDGNGDGLADVVYGLPSSFAFARSLRFAVRPSLSRSSALAIYADLFDGRGNRFARIGGANREPTAGYVPAIVSPGESTLAPELVPECLNACPDATVRRSLDQSDLTRDAGGTVTALAASPRHAGGSELAAGMPSQPLGTQPRAGAVAWFRPGKVLRVAGASGGDRLGESLLVLDLDGDGTDELIVGAPGAHDERGEVYVLFGLADNLELAALPASAHARVGGTAAGDRFGAALAAADLDGDGRPEVVVGAPGAGAVYLLSGLTPGTRAVDPAAYRSLKSATGGGFGSAIAVSGTQVMVGAPAENAIGAVHALPAASFSVAGAPWPAHTTVEGAGGGFGTTIAAGRAGEREALWIVSPRLDGGTVQLVDVQDLASGPIALRASLRTLRAGTGADAVGTSLVRALGSIGDLVIVAGATRTAGAATRVWVTRAAALTAGAAATLDDDGRACAALFSSTQAPSPALSAADFDGDGFTDLAVAQGSAVRILRGPLP